MEVIVTIVRKLVYNLLMGLTTYLYRDYNPFTKYHGHPSIYWGEISHLQLLGFAC